MATVSFCVVKKVSLVLFHSYTENLAQTAIEVYSVNLEYLKDDTNGRAIAGGFFYNGAGKQKTLSTSCVCNNRVKSLLYAVKTYCIYLVSGII